MQSIPTADEMSTRWKVLLLLTSWLRTEKYSCRRMVPSANDQLTDDPRQNEPTKIDAIRAGRSETLAAPPGIAVRFDDDVGFGGFKLTQIVQYRIPQRII